ncbi:DUF6786 family protein [Ulvibacterium sp.]|uniref:DUF6786 family protein n=1 Tax=Ulvibacterium sp. TaxID=2665914 RepID=UPI00261E0B77|nr:DUF6786 family protein [Ulvibacterium sp.]
MKNSKRKVVQCCISGMILVIMACQPKTKDENQQKHVMENQEPTTTTYENDVAFMSKHIKIIELTNDENSSSIALSPALQGRVMTSTAGNTGSSYGWINRNLFESGETSPHFNAYGGEERFWLGPEGGQYSIFFKNGEKFTLNNWFTPKLIDLEHYKAERKSDQEVVFTKKASLTNYSGFTFDLEIERSVKILSNTEIMGHLGLSSIHGVQTVGYTTTNLLTNTGDVPWSKENGLLSIWLLGMFAPSQTTAVMIPYLTDAEGGSGKVVNIYESFGQIPDSRLIVTQNMIYFRADGQYRSKIGLLPSRAKDVLGAYDAKNGVLTIVKYNKPNGITDYVNSTWEIQEEPYGGDMVNSYNDGSPEPGAKPLGPFYELETSSPALALDVGESGKHVQTTCHFEGNKATLEEIALKVFGVSLEGIAQAFK